MPKEHTVFRFEIPPVDEPETQSNQDLNANDNAAKPKPRPFVLELHGSSFEHRPTDRATRRFVLHLPDL